MALSPHAPERLARLIDRLIAGGFVGCLGWVTWHLGGAMGNTMAWGFIAALAALPLLAVRWLVLCPTGLPRGWWWPLPMLVYAGWHAVSLSETPGRSAMDALHGLWMTVGFWIALHCVRLKESRIWVMIGVGLISVVAVALAFYQRVVDPAWLPMGRTQAPQYLNRSGGPFGVPNNFAAWLILILPAAWWMTWRAVRLQQPRAVVFGVLATAAAAGLALTVSRGAWISISLAAVVWTLVGSSGSWLKRVQWSAVLILCFLVVGVGSYFTIPAVKDRIDPMITFRGERTRPFMWSAAWKLWLDYPVWGSGGGSYEVLFEPYRPDGYQDAPESVHNDYLNTLSDYGLVGFGLSWGVAGVVFWRIAREHRRARLRHLAQGRSDVPDDGWKTAVGVGLLAFLLATAVDFHLRIPAVAWVFALGLAEWVGGRRRGDADPTLAVASSWWRRGLVIGSAAATLLVAIWASGEAWRRFRASELRFHARETVDALARVNAGRPAAEELAPLLKMVRTAVELDPGHEENWSALSMVLALQAHARPEHSVMIGEEAEAAARRALGLSEEAAWHWIRLGVALDLQGRWSEAGLAFGRGVKLAPRNARIWYYQGHHFSLNPITHVLARSVLATCLRLDGRIHQAEALRAALARSP